jgi:hypothetical protein
MTAISVEQLLEIVRNSSTTITLPDLSGSPEWMSTGGESFEVIDARYLERELREFIEKSPQRIFADLIGKTLDEADAFLAARAPYLKNDYPVRTITSPSRKVRPQDLVVLVEDGCIVEIVSYEK